MKIPPDAATALGTINKIQIVVRRYEALLRTDLRSGLPLNIVTCRKLMHMKVANALYEMVVYYMTDDIFSHKAEIMDLLAAVEEEVDLTAELETSV